MVGRNPPSSVSRDRMTATVLRVVFTSSGGRLQVHVRRVGLDTARGTRGVPANGRDSPNGREGRNVPVDVGCARWRRTRPPQVGTSYSFADIPSMNVWRRSGGRCLPTVSRERCANFRPLFVHTHPSGSTTAAADLPLTSSSWRTATPPSASAPARPRPPRRPRLRRRLLRPGRERREKKKGEGDLEGRGSILAPVYERLHQHPMKAHMNQPFIASLRGMNTPPTLHATKPSLKGGAEETPC